MVLYLELTREDDWFRERGGSHIPTALTLYGPGLPFFLPVHAV